MRTATPKYQAAEKVLSVALKGTLLERGFEQRSPTNFLLDCGTHTWRMVFGGECMNVLGSAREATGVLIPELDRILQELYDTSRRFSEPMVGTTHRAHFATTIAWAFDTQQERIEDQKRADLEAGLSKFQQWCRTYILAGDLLPREEREPRFNDIFPWYQLPDRYPTVNSNYPYYIATAGFDYVKIGRVLDKYWREYVWPKVEPCCHISGIADEWTAGSWRGFWGIRYAVLKWLSDDESGFRKVIDQKLEKAEFSDEEIKRIFITSFHDRVAHRLNPSKFNRQIPSIREGYREEAVEARRLCRLLGAEF